MENPPNRLPQKIIAPRIFSPRRGGTGLHFLEPFSGKNEQHKYLNKSQGSKEKKINLSMELSTPAYFISLVASPLVI